MLPIERLERIVEYINKMGTVSIEMLTSEFSVSKPTVLRDLKKLDEKKLISRVHGGATSIRKGTNFEPKHFVKEKETIEKKEAIARSAKNLIIPGETVLLDSGSTTLALAKQIVSLKNLTIITNDIKIAMTLCENDNIDLVVIGGQKRRGVYSLIGPIAENILSQLIIDKVFLGADAIDIERGLTNSNIDESNMKKTMIKSARETILLADSSKFNQVAFTKIADLQVLDKIVTDDALSKEYLAELEKKGVAVHVSQTGF